MLITIFSHQRIELVKRYPFLLTARKDKLVSTLLLERGLTIPLKAEGYGIFVGVADEAILSEFLIQDEFLLLKVLFEQHPVFLIE